MVGASFIVTSLGRGAGGGAISKKEFLLVERHRPNRKIFHSVERSLASRIQRTRLLLYHCSASARHLLLRDNCLTATRPALGHSFTKFDRSSTEQCGIHGKIGYSTLECW